MQCQWKPNPPGITTTEQAETALRQLAELRSWRDSSDEKFDAKIKTIETAREADQLLEFEGQDDPVSFAEYDATLCERLRAYALERMEEKTLKIEGIGQLARRTNPDRIEPRDGKDQLSHVQDLLSQPLVSLLRSYSLLDLLSDEDRQAIGKTQQRRLSDVSLLGLYRLKVEVDIDSLKASLKSGSLKATDLPERGFTWTQGEDRADVSIK